MSHIPSGLPVRYCIMVATLITMNMHAEDFRKLKPKSKQNLNSGAAYTQGVISTIVVYEDCRKRRSVLADCSSRRCPSHRASRGL